jgi:hypothetical protein
MRIAIVARSPLAASPWELFKALRRYTDIDARLINYLTRYPDGRSFPHDLVMDGADGEAARWIRGADLIHVHNYPVGDVLARRGQVPIIAQFHSLPRLGDWKTLMQAATRSYTIRQPLQLREYRPMQGLPNLIDPDEYRPRRREGCVIAFAPTTKAPIGHPASKGYAEVKKILEAVARKRPAASVLIIEGVPYEQNLAMKAGAEILIDDVVSGNWHRTSLEGACFGCAVVNASGVYPFIRATIETLGERLLELVDDRTLRRIAQEEARLWVQQKWHAIDGVKEYVQAYKEVLR